MQFSKPFHLQKWIDNNRDLLKPPVGNKKIYDETDDFIVMVVGGPNDRKDFHWEEGEELFYQLEGDIVVQIINADGERVDLEINEGEMFLLPPHIPHSPKRPAGSVGLVIERNRHKGEIDKLIWYCENCDEKLNEESFELEDIGTQIKEGIEAFMSDEDKRTCDNCGEVMESTL